MATANPQTRQMIGFFAGHLAVGLAGAGIFFALVLLADLFGLRGLILGDGESWLAAGLLLFGLVVTFGSAAMAVGVVTLGSWRDDEPPEKPGDGSARE